MAQQIKYVVLWTTITLSMTSLPSSSVSNTPTAPRVSIPGDITIGGLLAMMLPSKTGKCSFVSSHLGIESLESLLFAVDQINADNDLLPNTTLGVKVFDTCGNKETALNRAVKEFVLGNVWHLGGNSCMKHERPVIAVIGPTFSYEAEHVTPFFNLFEVPLISSSATSPSLSDKSKYEYFSRTITSDTFQVEAIIDLALYFGWTYIALFYSDEPYGNNGYELMKKEASKKGICLLTEYGKVPVKYDQESFKEIVKKIFSDGDLNVIVIFCLDIVQRPLLREILAQSRNRSLQIVGPDTLSNFYNLEEKKVQDSVKHVFFLHLPVVTNLAFNEYFFNLSPLTNSRNPWFKGFFESAANCSFEITSHKRHCKVNETLKNVHYSTSLGKFGQLAVVVDAVYAVAHALTHIQKNRCVNATNKNCLLPNEIRGKELLDTIRQLSFQSLSGGNVTFDSNGDVTRMYDVYYVGIVKEESYTNYKIGEWGNKKIKILPSKWKNSFFALKSNCSKTCEANQVKQRIPGKSECCETCVDCPRNSLPINKTICMACLKGFLPDKTFQKCMRLRPKHLSLDGTIVPFSLVIIPIAISAFGLVLLFFVAVVFIKFQNTSIVKASGRELSLLLSIGIFLSFLFPFVAILKPSPLVCFWQIFLDSLPTTMCYVAIAVKNNRLYRIFNLNRQITIKPALIRPKSQVLISVALISFQALLLITLMMRDPPRGYFLYTSHIEVQHTCVQTTTQRLISHSYNVILLIICTYYAYKTKNLPENFNEAKCIVFAMYKLCVTAAAFSVISIVTASKLNVIGDLAINCYRVTFQATILLVCFFIPKVYVILWKSGRISLHGTSKHFTTAKQDSDEQERNRKDDRTFNNSVGITDQSAKKTTSRSTQTNWLE